jgi:hypothetical protein
MRRSHRHPQLTDDGHGENWALTASYIISRMTSDARMQMKRKTTCGRIKTRLLLAHGGLISDSTCLQIGSVNCDPRNTPTGLQRMSARRGPDSVEVDNLLPSGNGHVSVDS